MSQYFTYGDLQGRVHTDVLTADPSCKTCSTSKCYNTYDNVQGVSLSKHTPFSSIRLGENDRTPVSAFTCDSSMLTCNAGILENADPYNVVVKSTSTCDPLNYKNYEIVVPKMTGSLDRNRVESPRYVKYKSLRNSSNLATDVIEPKSIRDLSLEKIGLDVYNIIPFDYKNQVVVPQVKTSLSIRPRPVSKQLSTVSSVSTKSSVPAKLSITPRSSVPTKSVVPTKPSVPAKSVVPTKYIGTTKPSVPSKSAVSTKLSISPRSSVSPKALSSSQLSNSSKSVSGSVLTRPTKPTKSDKPIKINRVPLALSVSSKRR